ncbi:unnamed protein product [Hymenolepis diminuta]|uniref:Uncharacterized protein n=1 Tax=Hymenolepis diminuta TaxID=6216 RepID=A0A0R3SRC5_HYMDI|nr:unnamed protein product [Hymenolepis diminuta]
MAVSLFTLKIAGCHTAAAEGVRKGGLVERARGEVFDIRSKEEIRGRCQFQPFCIVVSGVVILPVVSLTPSTSIFYDEILVDVDVNALSAPRADFSLLHSVERYRFLRMLHQRLLHAFS